MRDGRSSQVRAEAATWLARLHADNRTPNDESAFRAWLAASPEHAAAFEEVDRVWSAAGALLRSEPAESGRVGRRVVLAGLGGLTVAGGGLALRRSAEAKVFETAIGEQRHIALEDGSEMFLDAQTRVSALFTDRTRRVEMQYGRANFSTARDSRPFMVDTALRTAVSNYCNFDVHCDDGELEVVVLQGQVIVEPLAGVDSFPAVTLRNGERLIASDRGQHRDHPDLAALTSWKSGFETFDDVSLSHAARAMNRYGTIRLQVDPDVADLKVSGVYRVGDNGAFARSVGKLLPITIHKEHDAILLKRKIDE